MTTAEQKKILLSILETQDCAKLDHFIHNNGNINLKLNPPKQTLLALAVEKNILPLVKCSIACGADVNCTDLSGTTPLYAAKTIEIASQLILHGADLATTDKKGRNILYFHISSHRTNLVQYLTQKMGEHWDKNTLYNVQEMKENAFWSIIEQANRTGKGDEQLQAGAVVRTLQFLSPTEIIAFQKKCYQMINYAHTSDIWAAAFLINGGCSDDAFVDFKYWLLSFGEKAFFNSIKNPDTLLTYLKAKKRLVNYTNIDCPNIGSAAALAYHYRTGLDNFGDVVDYSNVVLPQHGEFQLDWDERTIEKKKDIFPKLWSHFRT